MRPVPESTPASSADADRRTGLPALRTWGALYWFVFGVFALWVALLTWLTEHFA